MFTLPCSTEGCAGLAEDGRPTCATCHDRNGYPAGWSRSRDDAWLDYRRCNEIRWLPIEGPGCNSHPVTPRPDACPDCVAVVGSGVMAA